MIVTGASAQSMGPPALFGYVARIDLVSSLADCPAVTFISIKGLVPFTQLVKVRGGNLVWALPSIRFS